MRRKLATIYAVLCTLLLVASFLLVFYYAYDSVTTTVKCLVGLAFGFIFAPIVHELGHVLFAVASKMDVVYVKCFCFKVYVKK